MEFNNPNKQFPLFWIACQLSKNQYPFQINHQLKSVMRKPFLLIIFIIFLCCNSFAQGPKATPPSADAAALGKYGTYPTDLAHGLVNISIPLYTIKTKLLEVPVSLSYHASGIKVSDVSSWVGLGWVLNAGGVLTRSIRGRADEFGFANASHQFFTHDQLNAMTDASAISLYSYLDGMSKGTADAESDYYSYNANGLAGSFLYNTSQQIIQIPYSNNRIIVNSPGSIYTIIADNGTKYIFDVAEGTVNQTTGVGANTAFYLSKIVSADGSDTIYFDYTDDNTYSYIDVYPTAQISEYQVPIDPNFPNRYVFSSSYTNISTSHTKLLSKIRFSNGYVNFITANDRHDVRKTRLSQIQVYSSDNVLKRTISLNQDYFISTSPAPTVSTDPSANIAYRMKLTGLNIKDAVSTTVQTYGFNYNTAATLPPYWGGGAVPNPNYFYGQDLYGYYNGIINNTHLLSIKPPTYTGFQTADRHVEPLKAQAGVLTEIIYPTGGSTKFYYESNTTANQTSGLIGGLRISAIDNYINNGSTRIGHKVFTYSGGILSSSTYYLNFFTTSTYQQHIIDSSPSATYQLGVTNYSNAPTFPMGENSNNGAYYQYITETDNNDAGVTLGKTDYQFEYEEDGITNTPQTLPSDVFTARYTLFGGSTSACISDMGWARGPLKSQLTYKSNTDGSNTLVKSIVNTYTKFKQADNYTGTNSFRSIIFPNQEIIYNTVAPIKQEFQFFDVITKSGVKKLTNTSESIDGITKSTNYFYDNTNNYYLTRVETTESNGDIVKTVSRYPQDKASLTGLPAFAATAIDTMVNRNMLNTVIENSKYINNALSSTQRSNYKLVSGNTLMVLPDILQEAVASNPLVTGPSFNFYDGIGNVRDLTNYGGSHTAYQWGYGNQYLVAEVKNASYNDIFYESFEEGAGNSLLDDSKSGHYSHSATYSKALTGLDAGSYILSYWQKSGTVWSQVITPVTVTGSTYTIGASPAINGQIDDVCFYPAGGQMTTYTYDPLIGITSITDPKGMTNYYEYDNFQRLVNIKDKDGSIIKHTDYHYKQ